MSSTKSTLSSFLVATTVTLTAVAAAIYAGRRFQRRRKGGDGNGTNLDFNDGSEESLVNERFQACVQVMGPQLSRLPQQTQLDYYGLFKQGTLGDCKEYQTEPPASYDLVATAKYKAWARLEGMDRMTAMQNYIEKALHFQFIKSIGENDDQDFELEGDAVMDVTGLDVKPSTLANEFDKKAMDLEDSQYPIHAAAREGNLEELEKLLESCKKEASEESNTSPNALDLSGQTPLHLATDRGHIECVKALILAGADINAFDHDGISILQAAVIGGDKECCHLLLLLGADPDHADNDGDTPRDSAQDDEDLKEFFRKSDDKTLSSDGLLDDAFLQELQQRGISIAMSSKTTETGAEAAASKTPKEVDIRKELKTLDQPLEVDLDDDGDMF